jgi:integrase
MAHIRKRTSKTVDSEGNSVVRYQVVWYEPVRDQFGAPTGKLRQTSETFDTERKAKRHLHKVEDQLESARGVDPSSAKAKAAKPLGEYAKQYLDSLAGQVDSSTVDGYAAIYRAHIGPLFGSTPVASITTADVARFRAQLLAPHAERSYVTRGQSRPNPKGSKPSKRRTVTRSPKTVKHIVGTLKRILDTALDDRAIESNPVVSGRRHTTKRRASDQSAFKHRPLSSSEVAALHDWIACERNNSVYALAVLFTAYSGVRAAELQGLQVGDVTLSDVPGTVGSVRVERTAQRRGGKWSQGTPKSDASTNRVIPLTPWLADDLRDYLATIHPFAGKPHAPLFPGRRTRACTGPAGNTGDAELEHLEFIAGFDWSKPIVVDNVYHNYFQPACKALGLGAVRFHDLRHTFATLALSAGEHYMQVSKWLGHSSYVLTLTTYADYIREDDTAAPRFDRPVAVAIDKVSLIRRTAN